jgi:hypothetical protein
MLGAKEDIAAFVQAREGFLLSMPTTEKEAGEAWASPRSWEMAAEALGAARFVGAPLDVQYELVKGAVGEHIAGEFNIFIRKRDLPNPEDILKDPTRWAPPEGRGDIVLAVADSVAGAVRREPTPERFDAAVKFFLNMVKITNRKDEVLTAVWDLSQERIRTKTKYEFPDEFFKTFHSIWKRMKSAEKKAKK